MWPTSYSLIQKERILLARLNSIEYYTCKYSWEVEEDQFSQQYTMTSKTTCRVSCTLCVPCSSQQWPPGLVHASDHNPVSSSKSYDPDQLRLTALADTPTNGRAPGCQLTKYWAVAGRQLRNTDKSRDFQRFTYEIVLVYVSLFQTC